MLLDSQGRCSQRREGSRHAYRQHTTDSKPDVFYTWMAGNLSQLIFANSSTIKFEESYQCPSLHMILASTL